MTDVEVQHNDAIGNGNVPEAEAGSSVYNDYYGYLMKNYWVQQALATYDATKHSCNFLETRLDAVENGVFVVANTAQQKVVDGYNAYYVRPKEAVTTVYNNGKDRTYTALETGKNVAVRGGTVTLGAAVVATQIGLALSAGGASLLLDSVGAAQGAGKRVVVSVQDLKNALEAKIWSIINETQKYFMIPVNFLAENTHSLLDIVSRTAERILGIELKEDAAFTVAERVRYIASGVAQALTSSAHKAVIDPASEQIQGLLDHISKSFVLVDIVRSKQEWAKEKIEELSSSVSDLKTKFENEASKYNKSPEEVLMNSMKTSSQKLRDHLEALKEKGNVVFTDFSRIEGVISYLQQLDAHLSESSDLYQVRDEVLSEGRQRLADLKDWTMTKLV